MTEITSPKLDLSPLNHRELIAQFDCGPLSSDGGLMILREISDRLGIFDTLAACLPDARDPKRIVHSYRDMIASRVMAISAGYEDCNDLDALRQDPALKMAIGRAPESGVGLPSQPTLSRLENVPALDACSWRSLARMGLALIDLFCTSHKAPPKAITLDIDDTPDVAHGAQQLCLFNTHVGDYCFKPIHVYDADSGKPITCLLFPGKRPDGEIVKRIIRHLVKRITRHWPKVSVTIRGDGHYASHKAMDWLEERGHFYIFGLSTNKLLKPLSFQWTDSVATERALFDKDKVRAFFSHTYKAGSWSKARHVVARVEATKREDLTERAVDTRFIVTNLKGYTDQALYEEVYCARGQAENLIKEHKTYTASDRTSCSNWQANQFRLFLHTAAYWLLHQLRERLPQKSDRKTATFETLRRTFLKIAVRITELKSRIKLSFPTSCAVQDELRSLCKNIAAAP